MEWCRKCKNYNKKGLTSRCIACQWQYIGQKAFMEKNDFFRNNANDADHETPYEFWEGSRAVMQSVREKKEAMGKNDSAKKTGNRTTYTKGGKHTC